MSAITNKTEFNNRVKRSKRDQLLIFHASSSDPSIINRYKLIALNTALRKNMPVEVHTIDIDNVTLSDEDVLAYQLGKTVICCTTINDGVVMEKILNPFELTVRRMVLNILI